MDGLIILALLAVVTAWLGGRLRKRVTGNGVSGTSYIGMAVVAVLAILVLYAASQG